MIAFAPSAYVWGRFVEDDLQRSAWTWQGKPLTAGMRMARGGTDAADRELGALAWPEILRLLDG